MSFGTGAVKVTPAHDPNDNICGKRNNLETVIIFTGDGKVADNCGQFSGMMRYDARVSIEEALKAKGLYRGKEPNKMRLGLCSRSGDIIEPMITPQWYVNCTNMAANAVAAVRNGEMKILPEFHEATWYRWLENIRFNLFGVMNDQLPEIGVSLVNFGGDIAFQPILLALNTR
jgi:valyl-tRNA synthetase